MYVKLPCRGAIWIERTKTAYALLWWPNVEWQRGELLVWWGRHWHVILTPPEWMAST